MKTIKYTGDYDVIFADLGLVEPGSEYTLEDDAADKHLLTTKFVECELPTDSVEPIALPEPEKHAIINEVTDFKRVRKSSADTDEA